MRRWSRRRKNLISVSFLITIYILSFSSDEFIQTPKNFLGLKKKTLVKFESVNNVSFSRSEPDVFTLYPWKAVCDERDDLFPKAIVILLFADRKLPHEESHGIAQMLSCKSDQRYSHRRLKFENIRVFEPYYDEFFGLFVICTFANYDECPERVVLQQKWSEVSEYDLVVERQAKRSTKFERSSTFLLCAQPLVSNIPTLSPKRIIESIEYSRLIGVSKIWLPVLNEHLHFSNLSGAQTKVLKAYEEIGILEMFRVPLILSKDNLYLSADAARVHYITYCMLKNALKYDYITAYDWDEAIGFDHAKFRDLSHVVGVTRQKFGDRFTSFYLNDTVFNHQCVEDAPALDYSEPVLTKAVYAIEQSLNLGKTIHDSKACLIGFVHNCMMYRTERVLSRNASRKIIIDKHSSPKVGRLLKAESTVSRFMRSFHFRTPDRTDGKLGESLKELGLSGWCAQQNITKYSWLEPKSYLLQNRIEKRLSMWNLN